MNNEYYTTVSKMYKALFKDEYKPLPRRRQFYKRTMKPYKRYNNE